MSTFPAAGDYYKAVQAPDRAFTVPELQAAEFVWDALGPTLARGSSAVVFQATVAGNSRAVRCYIRNDASSRDRYSALSAHLASHDLRPFVSGTTWLDSAIRVKGETWPVLQMGWIDGRTLNEYVDFLVAGSNTIALATLAIRWREMVSRLQQSDFAHGDLQHGNVLVDQEGQLRLVDFDGVWIPQLAAASPPTEYGHPNYQRPGLHIWDRWLDTFSALVIYVSLVALSKDPSLWLTLYNSKNLLFQKNDFFAPFETDVWKQLAALRDPQVDALTQRLRRCCERDWVSDKSLELVLAPQPGPAAAALPPVSQIPSELRWWEKTPAAPAAPGASAPGASAPGPSGASSWSQPQGSSRAAHPSAGAGPPTMIIPPGVGAAASLPAPPPLSAPLGLAGTGPQPQLRQTMAPAGAAWWSGSGSASGSRSASGSGSGSGPAQTPVRPPQYMPPVPGFPPGPPALGFPPGPPAPGFPSGPPAPLRPAAKQQTAIGAVSLGLGLVLLIIGAAVHAGLLVIVGLAAAAWGVWRLVTLGGSNTKPPGQT